jgi:hypothetical protein
MSRENVNPLVESVNRASEPPPTTPAYVAAVARMEAWLGAEMPPDPAESSH